MKTQNKKLIFKCLDWLFDVKEPLEQLLQFVFSLLLSAFILAGFRLVKGELAPFETYLICGVIVFSIYLLIIKSQPTRMFLVAWFILLLGIIFSRLWLLETAAYFVVLSIIIMVGWKWCGGRNDN